MVQWKSFFFDQLNLWSKLNAPRIFNGLKVYFSYFVSRALKKNLHQGMPISLSVEPTTTCNLGCPECPSGLRQFTRPTGNLNEQFFEETLAQLATKSYYITFYFQGEPFINPKFLEMVTHAKSKNMYTATSTNAHFLHDKLAKQAVESGLDRLIISIDGSSQETYEQYRITGKLDKVIEGTKNVLKWKKELKSKTPYVIFQFLVVRPNEHQIDEVKALGKSLGVDEVKFKTAQVYDYTHGNPLIPTKQEYSRYKQNADGTFEIKNKLLNQCWRMWSSCVITWDGLVVPCCFDKDAQHQMGDLKEQPFSKVWRSPVYNNFRTAILKSRSEIEICKNCTEGTKVWG